jgi:hypothetical protein
VAPETALRFADSQNELRLMLKTLVRRPAAVKARMTTPTVYRSYNTVHRKTRNQACISASTSAPPARAPASSPPAGEIEDMARIDFGRLAEFEAAATWRDTLFSLIAQIPLGMRKRLAALAIDGTSASVLACDEAFNPVHPPLLYNDARAVEQAALIRQHAGASIRRPRPLPAWPRRSG